MLIDHAEITIKAGDGGNGKVSFRRNAKGPNGGNGGRGGNFYIVSSSDLTLLNQFSQKTFFTAENGVAGGIDQQTGRKGEDFELTLPIGTSIIDQKTGNVILDLDKANERYLIAKGGKGGRGNWEFRSARETTPRFAEEGVKGEEFNVILSLKLIADFGLVGLPNAGKSSLLNALTKANAKVGNYSFTTLFPNLGVCEGKIIADIPGLIEGAHTGKGLGIGFLKHIEKVETIIHCISADSTDPLKDYETVRGELSKFSESLLTKKEIIVITKTDLVDEKIIKAMIKSFDKKEVLGVSIYDIESLGKLKGIISSQS